MGKGGLKVMLRREENKGGFVVSKAVEGPIR